MRDDVKKIDKGKLYNEKKLVARCIKGDKSAWDEFVENYKGLIYSTILRTFHLVGYKNSEEAAGDLFQNVFALLLKDKCVKLKSFKWKNGCSLTVWLHVVAKHVAFDYMRKIFSREKFAEPLVEDTSAAAGGGEQRLPGEEYAETGFLETLEHEERVKLFERALKELPKEDVYLVELVYFQGLRHTVAAKVMGKSAGALYMHKKRVVEKLTQIIRGYLDIRKKKPLLRMTSGGAKEV